MTTPLDLYLNNSPFLTPEQEQAIDQAKETLKQYGYLVQTLWSKGDIVNHISNDPEEYPLLSGLSKDELQEAIDAIAEAVEDNFDADLGITWESIGYALEQHEEELREQLTRGEL